MNTEELRHLVDEVAASATNWHLLALQLQRPPGGPNDPIPACVGAFYYMLYPITEEAGREAWGPFAPVFEGPQGVVPPPLAKVEDQWLTLWADLAQESTAQSFVQDSTTCSGNEGGALGLIFMPVKPSIPTSR